MRMDRFFVRIQKITLKNFKATPHKVHKLEIKHD